MERFVEQLFHDPILQRPQDILSVVVSLLSAALLALPIAWVYMLTAKKDGYKQSFVQALVFLSFIVAAAMLVIGNNLARAFGLVGAVSIIRFRSRVNNPKDIAYIFVAITIGMASGLGLYSVALLTSLVMNILALLFRKYDFAATQKSHEYLVTVEAKRLTAANSLVADSLEKMADRWRLEKVESNDGTKFVLEYFVWLKGSTSIDSLLESLRKAGNGNFSSIGYVDPGHESAASRRVA